MGREARQSVKTQDGFSIKVEITQRNMAAGGAYLGKDYGCDCLYYRNLRLESGRIYGLISEYGQGCMYLSWLLGGKAATDELLISLNDQKMSRRDLQKISWNLEPSRERYRNAVVIKAIQNAIWKNGLSDSFSDIQNRFFLSSPRQDRGDGEKSDGRSESLGDLQCPVHRRRSGEYVSGGGRAGTGKPVDLQYLFCPEGAGRLAWRGGRTVRGHGVGVRGRKFSGRNEEEDAGCGGVERVRELPTLKVQSFLWRIIGRNVIRNCFANRCHARTYKAI